MLLSDTLLDGSSSLGPFEVAHGFGHCTIQVSPDTIVVTGGVGAEDGTGQDWVTSYKLTDGSETPWGGGLIQGRAYHACGAYHDAGGQQVSTVNLRKNYNQSGDIQALLFMLRSFLLLEAPPV